MTMIPGKMLILRLGAVMNLGAADGDGQCVMLPIVLTVLRVIGMMVVEVMMVFLLVGGGGGSNQHQSSIKHYSSQLTPDQY